GCTALVDLQPSQPFRDRRVLRHRRSIASTAYLPVIGAARSTIRGRMTPQLEATLAKLPTRPGVYLMKDARGNVLYVGKAQNLRNRVRSYWQKEDTPGLGQHLIR